MLSRADVFVYSQDLLTCSLWLKATAHLHINREREKTNKRKKRENKLYAQQRHKQHEVNYMQCNPSVLPKHIKNIFYFFYVESKFTTCALFQFPSYVHFTLFFGLLFQLTHTHTKIMFSHFKVMSVISIGFLSRKFPSDTSSG